MHKTSFSVLAACTLLATLSSCSNGNAPAEEPIELVAIFVSEDAAVADTGGASFEALEIYDTLGGALVVRDGVTGSVLLVATDGSSQVFSSAEDIGAATGSSDVALGPLDQVRLGVLEGQLLSADAESGLLIRLDVDGTPRVHSTEAQITAVTGEANAQLSLPRALLANQIIVQDLVSGDILLIGNTGAPSGAAFVEVDDLASAAGVASSEARVAQWAQGGSTGSQFARFAGSLNVVRVTTAGVTERWVEGADLEALFPDVADLTIRDLVADRTSDDFLILVGDGTRGIAIALVKGSGALSVFTTANEIADEATAGYDIVGLGIAGPTVFGIDGGNGQILTFSSTGLPNVLTTRAMIEEAADTSDPMLSVSAPLLGSAVLVFESTRNSILRIE